MSIPLSVPAGLLAGWGAGVAAPWPMPVAAVMTAARARQRELGTRPGAVCAAVGLGCIVGAVIEPVTCRPRLWSPATRLAIGVNLATSAALIGGRCLPCGRCVPPAPRALAVLRGWGAKRGANVGRRQATPGDNQAMVSAARLPIRPHPATCSNVAYAPENRKVGGWRTIASGVCCWRSQYRDTVVGFGGLSSTPAALTRRSSPPGTLYSLGSYARRTR